jgi:hypothetical protein
MSDEIKEIAAGPGSGRPPKEAYANADGSSPSPAAHVQPGGPKKKRGRPKKKPPEERPECTKFLQQFPHFIKVIYPSTNSPEKMGIFVFKKDETTVGIARFTQNDKGDVYWSCRKVPNKWGGIPKYIYDLIEIAAVNVKGVAQALTDILVPFGGEQQIVETYKENVKQADEKRTMNAMDDKLKNWGVV